MFRGQEVPERATHYVFHPDGDIGFICMNFDGTEWVCCNLSLFGVELIPLYNTKFWEYNHLMEKLPNQESNNQHSKNEQEKNMKEFDPNDLQTGMVLEFENGRLALVLRNFGKHSSDVIRYLTGRDGYDPLSSIIMPEFGTRYNGTIVKVYHVHIGCVFTNNPLELAELIWKREEKTSEQLAYEQLQAQIADEEMRHNESMKALREQAEKLKPKGSL